MGIYSVIDHRAWKVLRTVVADFCSFAAIEEVADNRIQLNGEKLGVHNLQASYQVINKWMGRIYVYTWMWSLSDHHQTSDLEITCKYSGKMSATKEVRFVSKQTSPLIQRLNQDKQIQQLCNSVDYELLQLRYSQKEKSWQVEMRPNYGDFIWILLPPVRYARRPKQQEIKDTMALMERIAQLVSQSSEEV